MRSLLLASLLLLSACAARAPEPKLRFSEVFRAPERLERPRPHAPEAGSAQVQERPSSTSMDLQAALIAFAHRARQQRAASPRGERPMPPVQIRNWDQVMTAVDEVLARPPRETSSYDVIRSRVTLEAELEQDARAYSELPDELYTAVELRKARLYFRMGEVRRNKTRPRTDAPEFIWPVSPVMVTSLFGPRLHPVRRAYLPHQGLDLAADFGQEVYAAAPGIVTRAGWLGGHGNHVEVQHAGGVVTTYSHLADFLVEPGMILKQGQPLGLAGSTGVSTGVHVHFELRVQGRPMDPLDQLPDPEADRNLPVALR